MSLIKHWEVSNLHPTDSQINYQDMTIKPGSFKFILELPNIICACNGIKICTLQKGYAYSYFAKSILMQKLNQPHIDTNASTCTHTHLHTSAHTKQVCDRQITNVSHKIEFW